MKRYFRRSFIAVVLATLAGLTPAGAQTVTDLHQTGWIESIGQKVNNAGQVIGTVSYEDFSFQAFFYDGSTIHLIGAADSESIATDLNDSGQVVGSLFDGGQLKPFVFANGQLQILENLGGSFGDALDINNAGQVTGYSRLAGNLTQHAFLYTVGDPQITDIDTLGSSFSTGFAVNEAGQVMGERTDANGRNRVFRYSGGQMTELAASSTANLFSRQINAAGAIVGDVFDGGTSQAFVAFGNSAVPLGTLGGANSNAEGINDDGVVIGNAQTASNVFAGFRWTQLGGMEALPFGSRAVDINNLGDILADGVAPGNPSQVAIRFRGAGFVTADLGGSFAVAVALNEAGDFIAVGLDAAFNEYGFRYSPAGIHAFSLGGNQSDARSINDSGTAVGGAWTEGHVEQHAYFATLDVAPDTTAPVTSAVLSAVPNAAGWFNADVTLDLSAADEDGGSGVKEIRYAINGGAEVVVEGDAASIPFTANGIYSVQFFAVDNAGNTESAQSVTVRLDKSAAETSAAFSGSPNGAGWFNSNVSLNLSSTDAGDSGVKQINYSINGTPSTVTGSSTSLLFSTDGVYSVLFSSVDNADNVELQKTATVKLDKTAPAVSVNTVPFILEPPNNKMRDVTVSGQITDNLSGIASASYTVHDEYGLVQPSGSITVNADGSYSFVVSLEASRNGFDGDGRLYTVKVTGVDAAGNSKQSTATIVVPH